MTTAALLVFSDLDGTLLDHQSYSYSAARRALAQLKACAIPLVLISSKTRAEILPLHRELTLDAPFVSENGAAIFWPEPVPLTTRLHWRAEPLAQGRSKVLAVLAQLRQQQGFKFTGISDCTQSQLVALTGLSPAQASLAMARDYSEPLLWQDSAERLEQFKQLLLMHNLHAEQGGRFLTVMGACNKALAMARVQAFYRAQAPITTVALGDSFNDEAMLQAADIAVVIKSASSALLQPEGPDWVIRTTARGPEGWQEAMDIILPVLAAPTARLPGRCDRGKG